MPPTTGATHLKLGGLYPHRPDTSGYCRQLVPPCSNEPGGAITYHLVGTRPSCQAHAPKRPTRHDTRALVVESMMLIGKDDAHTVVLGGTTPSDPGRYRAACGSSRWCQAETALTNAPNRGGARRLQAGRGGLQVNPYIDPLIRALYSVKPPSPASLRPASTNLLRRQQFQSNGAEVAGIAKARQTRRFGPGNKGSKGRRQDPILL
ncbi:MAG: hypothetical protein M1823_003823 [Watsoniomyces obsoletus]|nr:MAG: hypothetical protein M1823_003823 [Watsoniomyces obsoletus]